MRARESATAANLPAGPPLSRQNPAARTSRSCVVHRVAARINAHLQETSENLCSCDVRCQHTRCGRMRRVMSCQGASSCDGFREGLVTLTTWHESQEAMPVGDAGAHGHQVGHGAQAVQLAKLLAELLHGRVLAFRIECTRDRGSCLF